MMINLRSCLFIFSPSILFGLVFLKTFRSSHFLPKGDVQQNVKDNSDVDQCNGVKNVIDLLHDLFDEAHNRKETEKYGVRVYAQYTDHHPRFCNAPAVFQRRGQHNVLCNCESKYYQKGCIHGCNSYHLAHIQKRCARC